MQCSTVPPINTATVWIEEGAFAFYFGPHHGAFGSSSVPVPRNLPPIMQGAKKDACQGVEEAQRGAGWI